MLETKLLLLAVAVSLHVHLSKCDVHMFVSPNGSDKNDGLLDSTPVKTIIQALTNGKQTKYNGQTLYIELMQGYHDLERTLSITRSNTTIRSYKHQEVHVTGGRRIPITNIKHVTDKAILARLPANARQHIRVVNLHDLNIRNFGKMQKYGSGARRASPLEVFYNGQPLHLARWPNEGFLDTVAFPDGLHGLRFRYNSTVPPFWQNESDPWTYGYWYAGWTDGAVKVASMDVNTMIVTLAEKPPHGFRNTGHWQAYQEGKTPKDGGYFRFINILSELDQPGEFYMDRDNGKLYMWVPNHDGNVKSSDILYIAMIDVCLTLNSHAQNVQLEDFTLEACRRNAISVRDAKKVKLYKMEVRNTGNIALYFTGNTKECEFLQCYIHDTCGGLLLRGGDRKKLESSGNIFENNELTRTSRVGTAGNDALMVFGDGHVVKNNHIYNSQSGAINFGGNNIIIENNLIHHVCESLSSCNAIRTGYDWTFRGNVIRYNTVHHSLRSSPGGSNRAIYLDGLASGTSIISNVLYENDVHIRIGGGRYNEIINNVMYNATSSAIYVDSRGVSQTAFVTRMYHLLHAIPFNDTTWSLRYPHLAEIEQHNASLPEGNQINKNVIYAGYPKAHFIWGIPQFLKGNLSQYFNMTQTIFSAGSVDHFNAENGDLRVKCRALDEANNVNFRQVLSPNAVGPLYTPVGTTYLNRGRVHLVNTTYASTTCATLAPPKETPIPPFIPDGSSGNHVFPVENTGCWLNVTKCGDHAESIGTYRDMYGERYRYAADNETMCFRRAVEHWKYCGSHRNEAVVAIYGPTGSATLGGEGCFRAWYGCPKHGGPADGHVNTTHGQYFTERMYNLGEEGCLKRAVSLWRYCGSSPNYPVTSIYTTTGAKRTAGGGCWITLDRCPAHTGTQRIFYDINGATYYQTDHKEFACLHRAEYYWHYCGSNAKYPVTATYRPTTVSQTYPETD